MSLWELDPRLARDSIELIDIGEIQVRAMAEASWPWLLLIPRCPGAVELGDLPVAVQAQLGRLTVELCTRLKAAFAADKINVGALGNVVSQLHVHIVARHAGDAGWPGPVWGKSAPSLELEAAQRRLQRLREVARAAASAHSGVSDAGQ